MVPQTYPSILNPYTNMREMVVKQLASTSGLQRWVDYIPMKLATSTRPAGEQTTDADGFIAINSLQDTSSGVAFKDWVPVYFDSDATDAWVVSDSGYIPVGASGGAIAILQSFGSDAHVYLPGSNGVAVSGLLTNNYTLSDGSTGYSAIDGTAGLVLDAAGSVGAELALPTTSTAGWSTLGAGAGIVSDGTSITLSTASANNVYAGFSGITVGATYQCTVIVDAVTSCLGAIAAGAGSFVMNGVGTYSFFVTCTAAGNTLFSVSTNSGAAASIKFRALSIKQVTGIHATQATTANKPAVRRGSYNLLLQSSTFSSASWTKTDVTPTLGESSPLDVGSLMTEGSAGTALTAPTTQPPVPAGSKLTLSVLFKRGNTDWVRLNLFEPTGANGYRAWFNLGTGDKGSLTVAGTATGGDSTIKSLGNGWYRCSVTCTPSASYTAALFSFAAAASDNSITRVSGATYTVSAAQLEIGATAGDYSPTTSAAASNPSAGRYSWQFDGSNDSLALGSVPFQMADDHCVIAGARADVATASCVFGLGGAGGQRIAVLYSNAGTLVARWTDDAAANSAPTVGSGVVTGTPFVATARKVGSAKYARLNGSQTAAENTAVGTTTVTTANIGLWTGVFHTGAIGPVIVIKGTISDADLLTLERWVASLTPNGPSF